MTKRQRKIQDKNTMRDALTNKRIGSKEVIWIGNAIDYVKKQGYLVIRPRVINEFEFAVAMTSSVMLLMPFIVRMRLF